MTLPARNGESPCPRCGGRGRYLRAAAGRCATGWKSYRGSSPDKLPCGACRGTGLVSSAIADMIRTGRRIETERTAAGLRARDVARRLGCTPAELESFERGELRGAAAESIVLALSLFAADVRRPPVTEGRDPR